MYSTRITIVRAKMTMDKSSQIDKESNKECIQNLNTSDMNTAVFLIEPTRITVY